MDIKDSELPQNWVGENLLDCPNGGTFDFKKQT